MIFLGAGERSIAAIKQLHQKLDDALSLLSAQQQPIISTDERPPNYVEDMAELKWKMIEHLHGICKEFGLDVLLLDEISSKQDPSEIEPTLYELIMDVRAMLRGKKPTEEMTHERLDRICDLVYEVHGVPRLGSERHERFTWKHEDIEIEEK